MAKKYEMDMCSGSLLQKMILFALPLMLSSILQLLFNAADVIVVGRFAGDNALAAVGSTGSLINLLTNLFIGLSVGTNVLTAQFYGAKREKDLKETIHTSVKLGLYSGIVLTVIGICATKQILIWMKAPDGVLELSAIYLKVYFLGMTSTMIYNFGSAILRAVGDTKRPLYFLLSAGIVNVILNLIFVIFFHWGVVGVAAATAISQTISAILIIRCLMKEEGSIHLSLYELKLTPDKVKKIVRVGLPAGFQGMVFSLSNVVIQSAINSFGSVVVAGNSAASNIEGFVYVAMNAFYQTTVSFTSQNYGAKEFGRIKKILFIGEFYVIITGLVFGNLVVMFATRLLGLYSSSAEVIVAGQGRLQVICMTYALCGIMDVLVGSLRGIGYSVIPMIVSLLGACGLRLIWLSTVFRIPRFHTVKTVYMSYPLSWTITLLVHAICFFFAFQKVKKSKSA